MATIEENGLDQVKWAQVTSFTAGALWSRNMSPSQYPTSDVLNLSIGGGATPGQASFLQVFLWAQSNGASWASAYDVDIAILGRMLNASGSTGNALIPLLVCRAAWLATESEHLYVASGERPIEDTSVDNTKRWNMAASYDFTQPASGDLAAQNLFESIVYQQMGKGAVLQVPCKGLNAVAVTLKAGALTSPGRVLVAAKRR